MQTVRHPNLEDDDQSEDTEKISVLVGTVKGTIEIFKLDCQFEYENGFLGDLGEVSELIGDKNTNSFEMEEETEKATTLHKRKVKLATLNLRD